MKLNISRIGGYDAANWLGFTFTSTQATASKGLVRLEDPYEPFAHAGTTLYLSLPPLIQNTDSTAPGYFRVAKGTCASATLVDFLSVNQDRVNQWIDVAFSCAKGQHFSINWYPRTLYFGASNDPNGTEGWDFPVATRRTASDPWTPLPKPHLDIIGIPIIIGPLPSTWIDAPKMLTDVVNITQPGGPITFTFGTAGWIDEIRPLQTSLTVVNPIRLDTGDLVLLSGDPVSLRRQTTITVTSCIALSNRDCTDSPLGVVQIFDPGATFTDTLGDPIPPQTAIEFGVSFGTSTQGAFDLAEKECRWLGGAPTGPDVTAAWRCSFGPLPAAYVDEALRVLSSPAYCPSGGVLTYGTDVICKQ